MSGLFGHGLNTERCQPRETSASSAAPRPSTGLLSPSLDESTGGDAGEHAQAADAGAQGGLDPPQGRRPAHFANPANPEMTPGDDLQ